MGFLQPVIYITASEAVSDHTSDIFGQPRWPMTFFLAAYAIRLVLIAMAYFATRALPVYYRVGLVQRSALFMTVTALFLLPLELLLAMLVL